jgi:hypothetical protein
VTDSFDMPCVQRKRAAPAIVQPRHQAMTRCQRQQPT